MSSFRVSPRFVYPEQRLLLPGGIVVELYQPRASDQLHPHAHTQDSLNLVLEGSLIEHDDEHAHSLPAGSLSLLPRSHVHAVTVGGRGASVLHAEYSQDYLARIPNLSGQPLPRQAWLDASTRALAERCRREWQQPDAYSSLSLESLVLDALLLGLRHAATPAAVPAWLQQLAQRWRDEPGRSLVIATEARTLGLSATVLSRQFRRHLGMRLPDFVLAQRMDAACKQLAEGSDPLAQIASRLGFADQSHFCRAFQRALGMPPSTYRRQTRT